MMIQPVREDFTHWRISCCQAANNLFDIKARSYVHDPHSSAFGSSVCIVPIIIFDFLFLWER